MTSITVAEPGALTLIQDAGRPGLAHLGVSVSGAMDRAASALANRLVGNPESAAVLEIVLGGLRLSSDHLAWISVAGAWGEVTIAGMPIDPHTPTQLEPGLDLTVGPAERGIRYYLAVRGGIAVEPVLGSRSTDTLASLGPRPVQAGTRLPVGPEPESLVPAVDVVPVDPPPTGTVELELRPGPRQDWFTADAWSHLFENEWATSARADRTGIRLEGLPLERVWSGELPSEGMLPGAIQVSPDGAPTILGPDHPTTGGYPVIAVVTDATLDRLAQLRPGQTVRFALATGQP